MPIKLEVKNLSKVFGKNPKKILKLIERGATKEEILEKTGHNIGVSNASFKVKEGEIFVVMGLSGSGKSTLIRCLNRLIEPTDGDIIIDGVNISDLKDEELLNIRRKKVAMVFQNFALLPHRTVLDNVAFGLEIQKVNFKKRREKAKLMLDLVGLKGYEDSIPKELSGGMQQRVGLARALATDPDILLLDEAFSALDPLIRKEMQDELISLQAKMQKTIIFITHDLDEALKIGDRIAIMKDGNIVQIGEPEEILKNPADDYVHDFVKDVNRTKVITASTVMKEPDTLAIEGESVKVCLRKMKEANISSIFVTDKRKRLKGVITADKAMQLIKGNRDDLKEGVYRNIRTVNPETTIKEILPLFSDYNFPIAVTEKENELLGIIFKASVLSGLLGEEELVCQESK